VRNTYSYTKFSITLFFGVLVFLFYGLFYPNHIHYQEQYQIFQFSVNYFFDTILVPGGIAIYISGFFTQFFFYSWVGAFIIAGLLVIIQILFYSIIKKINASGFWYLLTFIPSLTIWGFLCDENGMLTFAIAVVFSMAAVIVYQQIKNSKKQLLFTVAMMVFLFWAVGGAYIIFVLIVFIKKLLSRLKIKRIEKGDWILTILPVLYMINILIARAIIFYPVRDLIFGIGYYRFITITQSKIIPILLVIVLLPMLFYFLPDRNKLKKNSFIHSILFIQVILVAGAGSYWIVKSSDFLKEEALAYDYLVRIKNWSEIIKIADAHKPSSPIATACLNLALAKTGQLGDRLFDFNQEGRETLIPSFRRDFTSSLVLGEIYYHLGLVNASQRLAFEAMEAIPDYQKSTRCYIRLAETCIINGQYDAAVPFLMALSKTLFYKKWALDKLALLGDEEKINTHFEYGWQRKIRCTNDFIFADNNPDAMLYTLMQNNPENKMAFQYLMAWELLNKNLKRFVELLPLGDQLVFAKIPKVYMEALLFVWKQEHKDFNDFPWKTDRIMLEGMQNFLKIAGEKNSSKLEKEYGNTFWYYFVAEKTGGK